MLNYSANGPSGYNLTNSLRFRASNSAYLNRTPATTTNQTTFTWSFWLKRGALSSEVFLYVGRTGANFPAFAMRFNSNDTLQVDQYTTGGTLQFQLTTTQVFRDPSAWYHIVIAFDTTQATSSNRIKFYINGLQVTTFGTATYPSQNLTINVNTTNVQYINSNPTNASWSDIYLTEYNFIDGQALTPSSFGNTNSTTGVWQPAKYTGTYGTNGFYLNFTDIALTSGSNAGLGKDNSGNGNYWNTNNISVTAGTTYDAMTDVPTLTSATVANYAVLNPLFKDSSVTVSDANMYFTTSANSIRTYSTIGLPTTGKYYWEFTATTGAQTTIGLGTGSLANNLGGNTGDIAYQASNSSGSIVRENTTLQSSVGTTSNNDIISVAVNMDSGTIAFYKNNVQLGSTQNLPTTTNTFFPAFGTFFSGTNGYVNFGQRPFSYTPPTGFVRLNTFNLPTPTILQGNKYMDATLYTGNSTTGRAITNAQAFKPDFVWIKVRSTANFNDLFDTVRGASVRLISNSTSGEATNSNTLASFTSTGFTLGTDSEVNASPETYVGWQWQAGQGSTSSNTSGSITSTVSVNTTAGFSVVTYTGNATNNATIGHGLGVAPKMVITKNRATTTFWYVYHSSLPATYNLYLNATDAQQPDNVIRSTSATTFTVSSSSAANGTSMVAYCWAEIAGFSRFGSYTGNGSTDGPFIYTGFRPKFIMVKRSDAVASWGMIDTARGTFNSVTNYLQANDAGAEQTDNQFDILSNGFKCRLGGNLTNTSGGTYIFMAFAENPFKNSLAR